MNGPFHRDFVRVVVARLLYRCALLQIPQAFSASLEFFCGERSAESVAALNGELTLDSSGEFGYHFIDYQLRNGERTQELKLNAAHRYSYFCKMMIAIIRINSQFYLEQNISENEYCDFSFSAPQAKKNSFISPNPVPLFCWISYD